MVGPAWARSPHGSRKTCFIFPSRPDDTTQAQDPMYQSAGVIFFIDVGMSIGVDNSQGPLMTIHKTAHKTTATAIYPTGKTTVLGQV